jgi:PHP family Zn ribbon phosphoesterase|nr:PHP domain-containing protein [Bacillota bacterium]
MSGKISSGYDLHIHSCLSPCADFLMTPGNIVKQAAAMGLEYIAITDHNSAGNVRAALEFARKNGLKLIPAMEVETREEVHLLCYFSSVDALLELEEVVHKHLPDMDNDEELFGYQLLTDHNDEYTAKEERLLALATELSLVQALKLVTNLGGVAVPAHVDRPTNSILGQLGFIPPDERITVIEISRNTDPESFLRRHPQLKGYGIIQGSDSHYLPEIGCCRSSQCFGLEGLGSILQAIF